MLTPKNLKIEYKTNPLGMDEIHPRFFYQLSGNGTKQVSRRIIVKDPDGCVVWDSGTVFSSSTIQIEYTGKRFHQFTRYTWNVDVADDLGEISSAGEDAFFETGFLGAHWTAKWITAQPDWVSNMNPVQRFFRDFEVKESVESARLYITSLGLYEAYMNGENVTENCLTPGWTDYYKRVQYQAYDVTKQIHEGVNTFSSILGEGWYSGRIARIWAGGSVTYGGSPMIKMELHVKYSSGKKDVIASDNTFGIMWNQPAIKMSDIYMGETCEAWIENPAWKKSDVIRQGGGVTETESPVEIVWQSGANIRRVKEIFPKYITKRPGGSWLVDFGQNLAGRERIRLKNTTQDMHIVIRHGEMLNEDGSLYTENLRSASAVTNYVCGNHDEEVYEPTFTFYGFRYLEIAGWPGDLMPDMISAQVLSSDLESTGEFSCSNPLLNQLYSNIVRGQRSNFVDVPTDCPQRDERLGWTGDTQVFANMATYNSFAPEFYNKWLVDLNSCQTPNGGYPNFAPNPYYSAKGGANSSEGATGWGDSGIICPWVMLQKYGDVRISEKYFDNMSKWIEYQIRKAGGKLIVKNACYGDWLNINDPTPEDLLSTSYLAGMCRLLSKIAKLIDREGDAKKYAVLRDEVVKAFGQEFFKDGKLVSDSQTAYLLCLEFDLCPDEKSYRNTCASLVKSIREKCGLHLSTGFLGTPLLMKVLTKINEVDLAYELLQQTTYPGWLYPVTQGATTMWERWNSWSDKDGFGDVGMNSFNHYAYGAVGEWFFESICGIQPVSCCRNSIGFSHWKLAPVFGKSLKFASASYNSINGLIKSSWKREDNGSITWQFTVPVNTEAEIVFPVCENIPEQSGIKKDENGKWIASPGEYSVSLTLLK